MDDEAARLDAETVDRVRDGPPQKPQCPWVEKDATKDYLVSLNPGNYWILWDGRRVDGAFSNMIGTVQLSASAFKPSDVSPTILLAQLGQVEPSAAGVSLEPVLRFDIRLRDRGGKDLGLLSRLRDVLPGRYAFGLTGRGPDGKVLPAGRYSLGLRAFPAAGGRAVTRSVVFTVK